MNSFISDYREFKEAFPESQTPWYLDITANINYATDKLISFELVTDSYTGGAHTNNTLRYININTNGQVQSVNKIITNIDKFKSIAEASFRNQKALSQSDDLSAAGYMFDNNQFQLPENLGFGQNGILLFYNEYEIAPLSLGSTKLVISYNKIRDLLAIDI